MSRRAIYALQSAYYVTTGLWSLCSLRTFLAVTGPKTDIWLVKTVGSLAVTNGVALGTAAVARERGFTPLALSAASALAFGTIDVVYAARRTIRPIYLGDAVVEAAVLFGLARCWDAGRRRDEGEKR